MTADIIARLQRAIENPGHNSSDFDLNPSFAAPVGTVLTPASVLLAILPGAWGFDLVLTKRSSRLKHHPGQIALPGGKQDLGDSGPVAAALREAEEEIGLDRNSVEILGTLPGHQSVTGYGITPVLGLIRAEFSPVPEKGEVEEVFTVPLEHVTDPSNFYICSRVWGGQVRRYYTVPYGPYYIWGATARILRGLADRMTV